MKITVVPVMGLIAAVALGGCASKKPPAAEASTGHPVATAAAGTTATPADHMALAKHYEDAAAAAQAEVDQHKKLMYQYKEKGYLYGKNIYNFEEHCDALIRAYEAAVKANLKLAEMHKKLAQP